MTIQKNDENIFNDEMRREKQKVALCEKICYLNDPS